MLRTSTDSTQGSGARSWRRFLNEQGRGRRGRRVACAASLRVFEQAA